MSLVGLEKHHYVLFHLTVDSDDLRTANIIADEQEGVTCLVIDRETFNQLISSLDEIRTRYKDEGVERRR
jgi:cGMP-dependent protein kinase